MARLRMWASGILGVLFLVVVFQNLETTNIRVLLWSWNLPLLVVMVAFASLGALVGALVALALNARRGNSPPA